MTYQVGQLFKVVDNGDQYHMLRVGSIVKFVGERAGFFSFELVEGGVDFSLIDEDELEDFYESDHLHECGGMVPSCSGQWLKPRHIQPINNEDEEDLYV